MIRVVVQKSVKTQQKKYIHKKNLHSRGMKSEPKEERREKWTKTPVELDNKMFYTF